MNPCGRRFPLRPGFVLLAALLPLGCQGPARGVLYDLATGAHAAERDGQWQLVLFGTPGSELETKGFVKETDPSGEPHAASKEHPQVFFRWRQVVPRAAVVDLAPLPGLAGESADVQLNDVPVGHLTLREGRHRYRVELSPEAQKRRENRIRFVFSRAAAPTRPEGPPLAARFYSLAVGAASEPALAALAEEGAPAPLAVVTTKGVPGIVQLGPGALRYALRLPRDAELRFTPGLLPRGAAGRITLSVTLEDEARVEREIWSRRIESQQSPGEEVAVPLHGEPGAFVRLTLRVGGPAWGAWSGPRVLGRGFGDPLKAVPLSEDEQRKAEPLRRSLARSNVLLLVLDAAGARHFGCYGYARRTTPQIDRLAAEGVVFERAYSPAVFTRSAMASVWTSQYPDQHHAGVRFDGALPEDRFTLAELLSARGVKTAAFLANPSAGRAFGLDQGFAELDHIYRDPSSERAVGRADLLRQALESWASNHRAERFFAYVHFLEPHFPYDPPPPFDTLFGPDGPLSPEVRRDGGWFRAVSLGNAKITPEEIDHLVRLYDGNLAYVDHQLGLLRRSLEAAGLWDRTVVIVTADHGEALYEHGFIGHNKQVYEESARIPLIVRFPKGKGPAGLRVRELVDLVDLAPTIADVFGLLGKGGSERSFRGRSLLAVASGAPGKPATLARSAHEVPTYAVCDGALKFIYNVPDGEEELYDLARDPGEKTNIAPSEPIRAAYYRQALYRWFLELRPEAAAAPARELTPEELESLKALGYVN